MSSLWTPSGGDPRPGPDAAEPVPPAPTPPDQGVPDADEAAVAEEVRRVRAELGATPVADLVANHAIGLWQLAVLHLTPEAGPPHLDEAGLAIDAMAALLDGVGHRLGEHEPPLREALSQLRLAFVQVSGAGPDA